MMHGRKTSKYVSTYIQCLKTNVTCTFSSKIHW